MKQTGCISSKVFWFFLFFMAEDFLFFNACIIVPTHHPTDSVFIRLSSACTVSTPADVALVLQYTHWLLY